MSALLELVDFDSLPLRRAEVKCIEVLRETGSHLVCRLISGQSSFVLKWFRFPDQSVELQTYALLNQAGIETLRVFHHGVQALLLEDLQSSATWRQAGVTDMHRAVTGRAVAAWYQALHAAGKKLLQVPTLRPAFLKPWVHIITPESLYSTGVTFGFQQLPVWKTALVNVELLTSKYLALPQTLNYTDFAAENLALSRGRQGEMRAVVFDYDCFATGVVFSDWRNIVYSLKGAAKHAFIEAYGPVSEVEQRLDEPLAILEGLVVAGQRTNLPGWAAPLVESVTNGDLECILEKALAL